MSSGAADESRPGAAVRTLAAAAAPANPPGSGVFPPVLTGPLANYSREALKDHKDLRNEIKLLVTVDQCHEVYHNPFYQAGLCLLSQAQGLYVRSHQGSPIMARAAWAKKWAEALSQKHEWALALNECRKTSLQLLYKVCDLCVGEDKDEVLEKLQGRRTDELQGHFKASVAKLSRFNEHSMEEIWVHCLVMDRANALYNMEIRGTGELGLGWYSKFDEEAYRVRFRLMNPSPSMNWRLVWLFCHPHLALGNDETRQWMEIAAPTRILRNICHNSTTPNQEEEMNDEIPDGIKDPVHHHLMKDPVIVDGEKCKCTCDRSTFAAWVVDRRKDTCPACGSKLRSKQVMPNAGLREMIDRYCPQLSERSPMQFSAPFASLEEEVNEDMIASENHELVPDEAVHSIVFDEFLGLEETRWMRDMSPMTTRRCHHTAVMIHERRIILVAGGRTDSSDGSGVSDSVEEYDVNAGLWTTTTTTGTSVMRQARERHASVICNGRVFVIGGYYDGPLDTIETLEVSRPAPSWSTFEGRLYVPRFNCAAVAIGKYIFVIGGYGGHHDLTSLPLTEIIDTDTGSVFQGPDMTTARGDFAVTTVDNTIVVMGGKDKAGMALATMESMVVDPSSDIQSQALTWNRMDSSMSVARFGAPAVSVGHFVLVAGGFNEVDQGLSSTELYDMRRNQWRTGPEMRTKRNGAAAVVLDGFRVIMLGGDDGSEATESVETLQLVPDCQNEEVADILLRILYRREEELDGRTR